MDTPVVPLSCEHNVGQSGDTMHCEEQLRTTLHCDDKEKLRRKLALLQREYLRTAERLQRAERSDAARSRIGRRDRRDPEVTSDPRLGPSPRIPNTTSGSVPRCHGHTSPVDSDASGRSQVIRFPFPSNAAGPRTPDTRHDPAEGHRPSPALRLRSRRSRLLWESRSAEAGRSADDNSEESRERSERMETAAAGREVKTERSEVANESEDLFSCDDAESPSLLPAHGNTSGQTETGDDEGNEKEGRQELGGENAARGTEGGEEGGNSREQRDGRTYEAGSRIDTGRNAGERTEKEKSPDGIKEESIEPVGGARGVKGVGLLDSRAAAEGLLYPPEYYVRTTRRMTLSQSRPDAPPVTLSQLSAGRRRRTRGGGATGRAADRPAGTSSPASASTEPRSEPMSRSSGELSGQISAGQIDVEGCFPPAAARPARGRRRRRGRGRGRPPTPRRPRSVDTPQRVGLGETSGDPTGSPVSSSSSPSLRGADGPAPCVTSTATRPSSGGDATQPSSGQLKKSFPIFLRTDGGRRTRSTANWLSLLLPSPPPAPPPPLPVPSLFPGPLLGNLANFDILQDFHLPDDQFASLKLRKLRQVAGDSGVEHFTPSPYNTRSDARRSAITLSLTPTISNSPRPAEAQPAADLTGGSAEEETPRREIAEIPGERQIEKRQTPPPSPESATAVRDCAAEYREGDPASVDHAVDLQKENDDVIAGPSEELEPAVVPSEQRTDRPGSVPAVESKDDRPEDTSVSRTLSSERLGQEPPDAAAAARLRNDGGAPGESPAKDSEAANRVPSPSPLASPPPRPSMTPRPHSSAPPSDPAMPSLGLSPHPLHAALPPPSSPALSPAGLSPRLSASSESPPAGDRSRGVGPPNRPALSGGVRSEGSGGRGETAEEHMRRCTHTLEAPAGGCLVDACCLRGSSGALCVAAAGAWAVCLWTQTPAADWTLTHTWAFDKPVISLFPVPDAAGLLCVTLGQLEIREVRTLSCSRLSQAPLCEGVVQAVVGVSRSRVVTSSHSASGSTLRVFTASDSGSTSSSQPLASPGVCVGALAPVDALLDALLGSNEGGRLFVWNLRTGQLLRSVLLGDALSHTACLRGFSSQGALFILLQHQSLRSPEGGATETAEEEEKKKEEEEEEEKAALFSLVAVNPVNGKYALASRLFPPKAWTGRLCEADASSSGVVGLSPSGAVCVWELGRRGASRTVAPDGGGWQLARWGEGGTLVTGHHNGDVTLHCPGQTSLCGRTR